MALSTIDRLRTSLEQVRSQIDTAAARSGRDPSDVTLVSVSKTWPIDVIRDVVEAGATDLGENRAQEFREKIAALGPIARWHFIGNLQTNKVRHVVGAHLIHSVDRYGLAEAIGRRATTVGETQDILMEVNVSGEPTKHGVEPASVPALADEIAGVEGVRLRGLMTMAPFADGAEASRYFFAELRQLSGLVTASHPDATELSMGMTRDMSVAVEEGATIVRVGEAIFGPRNP
jgi:pyridoxal phosphate enzyme (YggS family)